MAARPLRAAFTPLAGVRSLTAAASSNGIKHTTNAAPSVLRHIEDHWESVRE